MSIKQTNRFLLFTVIFGLIFDLCISQLSFWKAIDLDLASVSKYVVMAIVGIIILKKNNTNVLEYIPYNAPFNARTLLWVIVLYFLFTPVNCLLGEVGGIIFGNVLSWAVSIRHLETKNIFVNIFNIAVIPAVFEELFYRGFFYEGYKRGNSTRTAIILSAIIFGTFHMVAQQCLYAVFAGFILAMLRELSGSMWPGMLLHFINNGSSFATDELEKAIPNISTYLPSKHYNFETTTNMIIVIVASIIALPLIYLVLKRIAKIEGKEDKFKTFFKGEKSENPEKVVTAPLVISLFIECAFMVFTGLLTKLFETRPELLEKIQNKQ